jgi:hypothetical protein
MGDNVRKTRYSNHAQVDITYNGEDYILELDDIEIGNDGYGPGEFWGRPYNDKGHDYVEDFRIRRVLDAFGVPLSKDENDRIIKAIGDDDTIIEGILTDLTERLGDMIDDSAYDRRDDA